MACNWNPAEFRKRGSVRNLKVSTLHFSKSAVQSDNKLFTYNMRETSLNIQSLKSRKGVWQDSRILSALQKSLLTPEMMEFVQKIGGKLLQEHNVGRREAKRRVGERIRIEDFVKVLRRWIAATCIPFEN